MAARISAYTCQMYLKLIRNGGLAKGGRLPPVLPIVLTMANPDDRLRRKSAT